MSHYHGEREKDLYDRKREEQEKKDKEKPKRTRILQTEIDKLTPEEKKERRAEYKRKWNVNNQEKVLKMRKENNKKTRVQRKEKAKQYRKNNPLVLFTTSTMYRLTTLKASEIINNLPYSQFEFIAHIESLFLKDMSWENRNEWHIDHVIPISVFKAKGIDDINIINALTNLQPLWAVDNLTKSNNYFKIAQDRINNS